MKPAAPVTRIFMICGSAKGDGQFAAVGRGEPFGEIGDDAPGGMAVPALRRAPGSFAAGREHLTHRGYGSRRRHRADQRVGALRDRDRALGVLAQRQAGHAERRGFLLQAARVGQHQPRLAHQAEISRSSRPAAGQPARAVEHGTEAGLANLALRARMPEHDRQRGSPRRSRRAGARARPDHRRSMVGAASGQRMAPCRERPDRRPQPASARPVRLAPRFARSVRWMTLRGEADERAASMPSVRLSKAPGPVVYRRSEGGLAGMRVDLLGHRAVARASTRPRRARPNAELRGDQLQRSSRIG